MGLLQDSSRGRARATVARERQAHASDLRARSVPAAQGDLQRRSIVGRLDEAELGEAVHRTVFTQMTSGASAARDDWPFSHLTCATPSMVQPWLAPRLGPRCERESIMSAREHGART